MVVDIVGNVWVGNEAQQVAESSNESVEIPSSDFFFIQNLLTCIGLKLGALWIVLKFM